MTPSKVSAEHACIPAAELWVQYKEPLAPPVFKQTKRDEEESMQTCFIVPLTCRTRCVQEWHLASPHPKGRDSRTLCLEPCSGASSSFLHGNTERPRAEVRLSAAKRRLKDPQDLQHSYWLDIHSRLMGKAYSQEPVSSKTLYLHEKLPVGGFQSQAPISGILGRIRLITVSH